MKFSYIIAYKHNEERILNLKRVISWIKSLGDVEIIIIEQDDSPKLPNEIEIDFNYKFIENKFPFCKSWAFNIGTNISTNEIIVFGDSDLIMNSDEFLSAISKLDSYEVVNPYKRVIDLKLNENDFTLEELSKIEREFRGEKDIQKTPIAGGIIAFRKASLLKIGGWCEEFIGWGAEDDFQSIKIKMFLNWIEFDNRCYHLFHTRVIPIRDYYYRNVHILNQLASLKRDQMINFINNSKDKIAKEDKFKNLIDNK
jgi:hypothetical protein